MAKIKINLASGEITIEFTNTNDLEDQLQNIDLVKIEAMLERKKQNSIEPKELDKHDSMSTPKNAMELCTINLLKISEHGEDAIKLAVFLATSGMNREEIKKITGVTILSS